MNKLKTDFLEAAFITFGSKKENIQLSEKCELIAEDFALNFAEFLLYDYEMDDSSDDDHIYWRLCGTEQQFTTKELIDIFKEQYNNEK